MPLATIHIPPLNWIGDGAFKRELRLEDMLPGWTLPPGPTWTIRRLQIWNQPCGTYPPTLDGRASVGVDPKRYYSRNVGFPHVERGLGQTLKPFGKLELAPGRDKSVIHTYYPDGITYRPGLDALIIVGETTGATGFPFSIIVTVDIEADDFELDPTTVFSSALDQEAINQPGYCFRTLFPNTTPGTKVRFRIPSHAAGVTLTRASFGVQAAPGSPNMAATPIPALFGGLAAPPRVPWEPVWTDWVPLVQAGVPLLFNASLFAPQNSFCFRQETGPSCAWFSSADSYGSAAMASPTLADKGQRVVDAVQVM